MVNISSGMQSLQTYFITFQNTIAKFMGQRSNITQIEGIPHACDADWHALACEKERNRLGCYLSASKGLVENFGMHTACMCRARIYDSICHH